jgi:regulator of protease activity HflC (stomatin/prohibitin superfamily)
MDPINPLNQLIQALRQQMAAQAQKSKRTTSKHTERQTKTKQKTAVKIVSLDQIQTRIRERVRQLEPEQRDSIQAARIFVESILVWEFGEELLQDPRWQEISKEVQESMTGDPETWARFRTLLKNI